MPIFHPDNRSRSPRHAEIWAAYEIAYTVVDFTAAALFVVGSALFFFASTTYAATWLFLIGSVFFGLKPTLRLIRELKLVALGRPDKVADMFDS
ncbi:MAG: YrhK family protein [Rhodobacteraceae bacterium]|jgi:uncharacterized membrane protein YgdD (TMEM256/DUF423 family)|nr:YrhK family protein [Paracoccaceae bacterium]